MKWPSSLVFPTRAVSASRWFVIVALGVVGYALIVVQGWHVTHELQMMAPGQAHPEDTIPVRAYLFGDLDSEDGGTLERAHLAIDVTRDSTLVSRVSMRWSQSGSYAAEVPPLPEGDYQLALHARQAGTVVATVTRALQVRADAPPQPLSGRLAHALSQLSLGPLVSTDALAGQPLDVRVVGGACVPEHACEVLVDVAGADDLAVAEAITRLEVERLQRAGPSLWELTLVAHGPECAFELAALAQGRAVSRRSVRLPVALATPWLATPWLVGPTSAENPAPLQFQPPPGRSAAVMDIFSRGRWVHTATVSAGASTMPFSLGSGVYRVQVHVDPFSSDNSAVRHIVIGVDPSEVRGQLLDADTSDPPATDVRLVLAGAEEEVRQLPAPVSGLEADRGRVSSRQMQVYWLAGVAMLVGIAAFAVSLLHRGLSAAAQARELMAQAGDDSAQNRATRRRMTLAVVGMVSLVTLAFLAATALLLARAMLGT